MKIFAIHSNPEELAHLKEHALKGDEVYTVIDNSVFKIVADAETMTCSKVLAQPNETKMFTDFFEAPASPDTQVNEILSQIINRLDEVVGRVDNVEDFLISKPVFKKIN